MEKNMELRKTLSEQVLAEIKKAEKESKKADLKKLITQLRDLNKVRAGLIQQIEEIEAQVAEEGEDIFN
jgi:hypothetical protein